jgi:NADPH2:quinone reductase
MALRAKVAAGLKTTFASHYSREISLLEALSPSAIAEYSKQATGEKFLIRPSQ